jgi:hypothetical protein
MASLTQEQAVAAALNVGKRVFWLSESYLNSGIITGISSHPSKDGFEYIVAKK